MGWIDWSITGGLLLVLTVVAVVVRRYTRSVADFLAANRCAGRYLITVSMSTAGLGALSFIGFFEAYYQAGFSASWWQLIMTVQVAVVSISGWVVYRFRQTRVMTLAQFLEIRYSRRFRIFAGLVAWLAGIVNFGIFPAVGARFFIHYCGLPDSTGCFALTMAVLLSSALLLTFLGGQITVMVTDFLQGTFSNIMILVLVLFVLWTFGWSRITEALSMAPADASMLNPFQATATEDFNLWFYLIIALMGVYGTGAWQSGQGYGVCALNAHEARMGHLLNTWRVPGMFLTVLLLAAGAYTLMHHPDFATEARAARAVIASIENPQLQKQMTTPIAMTYYLPPGLLGVFAAIMLAAFISTHDTYLHSWGSVLIQDVVLPLRGKPLSPRLHVFLLRLSILGVAVFVYFFSLLFRQTEYVHMFFVITYAIFVSGAGAVVIGGLYWSRGTTRAAWAAMVTGAILSIAAVVLRQLHNTGQQFANPLLDAIAARDPAELSLSASVVAILVYVIVSLLDRRPAFNMDRMLHRGSYVIGEHVGASAVASVGGWRARIAMGNEFNRSDQILYLATMGLTGVLILTFLLGTTYNLVQHVSTAAWVRFWGGYIRVVLVLSTASAVWFTIGGLYDLKRMFSILAQLKRDDLDDGAVAEPHDGAARQSHAGSTSTKHKRLPLP